MEQEQKQPDQEMEQEQAGEQVPGEQDPEVQQEESKTPELEKLQAEFEAHKQQHLRVLAEYDNFRKRSQNEKAPFTTTRCPTQCRPCCPLRTI